MDQNVTTASPMQSMHGAGFVAVEPALRAGGSEEVEDCGGGVTESGVEIRTLGNEGAGCGGGGGEG